MEKNIFNAFLLFLSTGVKYISSIIKILLYTVFLLPLTSCSYLIDQQIERDEIEHYESPYRGTWAGEYNGDVKGDLIITVAKNGYTSVTRTSQFGTEKSVFSGKIRDDGALQGVIMDSGFTLSGNFITKAGSWVMNTYKGAWSVRKKTN